MRNSEIMLKITPKRDYSDSNTPSSPMSSASFTIEISFKSIKCNFSLAATSLF